MKGLIGAFNHAAEAKVHERVRYHHYDKCYIIHSVSRLGVLSYDELPHKNGHKVKDLDDQHLAKKYEEDLKVLAVLLDELPYLVVYLLAILNPHIIVELIHFLVDDSMRCIPSIL